MEAAGIRIATGRRAGQQRVLRVGDCIDPGELPALEGKRCASTSSAGGEGLEPRLDHAAEALSPGRRRA